MLPLVLGGIALTTVGYKLKKNCEVNGKRSIKTFGFDSFNVATFWAY